MSSSGASAATNSSKGGASVLSKLSSFRSNPSHETFPELPDAILWIRIVLGVTYGISLGLRNQVGFAGIMLAANVVTILPILYINWFLDADIDSYKNGLNFVGVPNAMATCILVWIIIFTHEHGEDERAFAAAAVNKLIAGDAVMNEQDAVGSGGDEAAAAAAAAAEPEATSATDTEF
mmetsp:Transcript_17310/g.34715  ORF Transcript_17310/g.34715 Transcript_17310/m.34715 type:complete len:178 (+) Transcript_17310:188-721(+)